MGIPIGGGGIGGGPMEMGWLRSGGGGPSWVGREYGGSYVGL